MNCWMNTYSNVTSTCSEQIISNNQCSNEFDVTKRNKAIESNVQKLELNKDTPPLNKVPSYEEQLTEIPTNDHDKYLAFRNNILHSEILNKICPIILLQKVHALLLETLILAGIDKNHLKMFTARSHHFAHCNK